MAKRMTDEDLVELSQKTTLYTEEYVAPLHAQLAAANARIAELEDAAQERITELELELVSLKHKLIAIESAKPATIHEVIDDFGETVTAVTL